MRTGLILHYLQPYVCFMNMYGTSLFDSVNEWYRNQELHPAKMGNHLCPIHSSVFHYSSIKWTWKTGKLNFQLLIGSVFFFYWFVLRGFVWLACKKCTWEVCFLRLFITSYKIFFHRFNTKEFIFFYIGMSDYGFFLSSKFNDIYDEGYFITTLENDVQVVSTVPGYIMERFDHNMSNVYNFRIKAWSSIQYYRDVVLPKLLEEKWVKSICHFFLLIIQC